MTARRKAPPGSPETLTTSSFEYRRQLGGVWEVRMDGRWRRISDGRILARLDAMLAEKKAAQPR